MIHEFIEFIKFAIPIALIATLIVYTFASIIGNKKSSQINKIYRKEMNLENYKKQFKEEQNEDCEITVNSFAHSVRCVNPKYVKWLEEKLVNGSLLDRYIKPTNESIDREFPYPDDEVYIGGGLPCSIQGRDNYFKRLGAKWMRKVIEGNLAAH